MKKLVIAFIVGAVILGVTIGGGDCSLALFLATVILPGMFGEKKCRGRR